VSDHTPENVIKALGFGLRHLIEGMPVTRDPDDHQNCQVIYLYDSRDEDGFSIFGMDYADGSSEFGDEMWCNAAYDAMEELAEARPSGVPLGFLLCTPMLFSDKETHEVVQGFWYGFGMDLTHGLKVTMKQEASGPPTVKPVEQPSMSGMLDQFSELFQ
jgi:hypothetical protein